MIATAKRCDKSPIFIKLNGKNDHYLHIWSQKNSSLLERFRLHKPPKIYLLQPALGQLGWLGGSFLRTVKSVGARPLNAWGPKHLKYWRGELYVLAEPWLASGNSLNVSCKFCPNIQIIWILSSNTRQVQSLTKKSIVPAATLSPKLTNYNSSVLA
jgi:hypothetical protein